MHFVQEAAEQAAFSPKEAMQLDIAVEEVFVNIANYAYPEGGGVAVVAVSIEDEPLRVVVTFSDGGTPYNPLLRDPPNLDRPLEERAIGGLGVHMVRHSVDDISYEYRDGRNILALTKIAPQQDNVK